MNETKTFTNETEHMDTIYEQVSNIKNRLTEIQEEIDAIDSEKLEKELHEYHIGWEGKTKDFWIKRIEEAISALSFAQSY